MKMKDLILITGGAGFVGSHLTDVLLKEGYRVRILDNLDPQVHGSGRFPEHLDQRAERIKGDVRDGAVVREALRGVDAVYHFAAAVGVGQSMYQIDHYTDVNNRGTAVLLEAIAQHRVSKLIVASSMSLYGEGFCRNGRGEIFAPGERTLDALKAGRWEIAVDGQELEPVPTPETKPAAPSSVYALSKYDQERLCLMVGASLGIPTAALRFFNIYGPRQALSNPYTGVLAIFSSRLLNNRSPMIFEDGQQRRDFVSVHDITRACLLALERTEAAGEVFNIGSGNDYRIVDLARKVAEVLGKPHIQPELTGKYRVGDIRHCFGDIDKAQRLLGYQPQVSLEHGLEELGEWLQGQSAQDRAEDMQRELASRGLSL